MNIYFAAPLLEYSWDKIAAAYHVVSPDVMHNVTHAKATIINLRPPFFLQRCCGKVNAAVK